MTTKKSPVHVLKAQADEIAKTLKAAERGDTIASDPAGKVTAARARDQFKFAVAMDDKILKIVIAWSTIRETTEEGLSEYILAQMREQSGRNH